MTDHQRGNLRVSDRSPPARRLGTPRWLDARLVLGVVLVLVAVAAGARVFASAGHYTDVYVARHALVPGEHLDPGDLSVGQVRFSGNGGSYVAAGAQAPSGYLVTRYVAAGEFVPLTALSAAASATATDGNRDVTVPVMPGHLPADISHGDLVDVYVTAKVAAGEKVPLPVRVLAGVPVDSDDGGAQSLSAGSTVAVVLAVPAARVTAIVHAVEGGTIDLVRVPMSAADAPVGAAASAGSAGS